jgi:hypothetical protein
MTDTEAVREAQERYTRARRAKEDEIERRLADARERIEREASEKHDPSIAAALERLRAAKGELNGWAGHPDNG